MNSIICLTSLWEIPNSIQQFCYYFLYLPTNWSTMALIVKFYVKLTQFTVDVNTNLNCEIV